MRILSYLLFVIEQDVGLLARAAFNVRGRNELVLEFHDGVGAVRLGGCLGDQPTHAAASIAGHVVPDNLQAILGNGERICRFVVFDPIPALDEGRSGCVDLRICEHTLGQVCSPVRCVHGDLVRLRVPLEESQLAHAQLALVLLGVLRSDGEQGGFTCEGVGEEPLCVDAARVCRQYLFMYSASIPRLTAFLPSSKLPPGPGE